MPGPTAPASGFAHNTVWIFSRASILPGLPWAKDVPRASHVAGPGGTQQWMTKSRHAVLLRNGTALVKEHRGAGAVKPWNTAISSATGIRRRGRAPELRGVVTTTFKNPLVLTRSECNARALRVSTQDRPRPLLQPRLARLTYRNVLHMGEQT